MSKSLQIGILTYDIKHRKTYDTLCLLKAKGYSNIRVYAQPLHYEKKFFPILRHRPAVVMDIPEIDEMCENFGYQLFRGRLESLPFFKDEVLLVCGAGLIPEDIVKSHTIINAHPGYIPLARGLDAFKWSIWEGKPIGVTSHIIGEYVDAGEVIERRQIQLQENDTFFEVAQRVYENEISMLVDAIEKLDDKHEWIEPGDNIVHKRMPHEIENQLLERFEQYKREI